MHTDDTAHGVAIHDALQLFSSDRDQFFQHFWEFFSFIAFGDIGLSQKLYQHLQSMEVVPWQAPLIDIGQAKYLSLSGRLFSSHLTFMDLTKKINKRELFPSPEIENEILAFFYYEQGLLAEKVHDPLRAETYHRAGSRLTSIHNFKLAYEMMLQIRTTKSNFNNLSLLQNSITQLENAGLYTLACIGWRTAGTIARISKNYSKATKFFKNALSITNQFKLEIIENQILLSIAILNNEIGELNQGEEYLNRIKPFDDLDPILSSKYEVLALMEQQAGNLDKSLELVRKALAISLELDHVDRVPDEALFLGENYEKQLHDLEKAEYYYRIGYEHSIRYAEHGIALRGDRKKVVDAYLKLMRSGKQSGFKSKPAADPFSFAKGNSWREIKDIFHHQVLLHHGSDVSSSRALAHKLRMPPTTLYSLQTRLKQRGYELPRGNTKNLGKPHVLEKFIIRHETLSWEEINLIFEREIMHYLYEKYGYNKQRMANILELSYPALINKTRELTQFDAHFLPN